VRRFAVCTVTATLILVMLGNTAFALTIQAGRARVKTAGGMHRGSWNLWSNGEYGDYVRFHAGGKYTVVAHAYGSPLGGTWPLMSLSVDGIVAETVTVKGGEARPYEFQIETQPGVRKIAFVFQNDAADGKEDRNLYFDKIEILPVGDAAEPVPGSEREWQDSSRKRGAELEDKTLEQANTSIERTRKDNASIRVVDAEDRPIEGATVVVEQRSHDFLFGCNIYMFDRFKSQQENELYKERFRDLFNYATTGFYWRGYEQERGKPNYAYTDKVVSWCARHNVRMKGHPLLWDHNAGEPAWAGGQPEPEVQKKRVTDIISRYRGRIEFWEVVNEPSHCRAIEIDQPYRWAREVNPDAYLIVNDYYVMANGFPPFFELLEEAKRNGVPFNGIGIQAHEPRTMGFPLDRVHAILDKYATLGKELHITEFTPTSAGQRIIGSHVKGKWDETAQAGYAEKFYTVCFAHPSVVAVTWWDLCDAGSWLEGGGLLRKDLTPKPAYTALKKLIHEQWTTRTEGTTDETGTFSFRGFHGEYVAKVTRDESTVEQQFRLEKDDNNTVSVTVR